LSKPAKIISVTTSSNGHSYAWKWRAVDGAHESKSSFVYFYEAVEDAIQAGYTVELGMTCARNVDGSSGHALR
jgi:hypothetical protein